MDQLKLINKVTQHFKTQTDILINLFENDKQSLVFIKHSEYIQYEDILKLIIAFKFYEILTNDYADQWRREIDLITNDFIL